MALETNNYTNECGSVVAVQGEQGPQGEQGLPGPQGEPGEQGEQGPAGSSFTQNGNIPIINSGDLPSVAFTENDDVQPLYDALNARPLKLVPHGTLYMFSTVRVTATSSNTAIADKRFYFFRSRISNIEGATVDASGSCYGVGSGITLDASNMGIWRAERYQLELTNGEVTGTTINDIGDLGGNTVSSVVNSLPEVITPVNEFILIEATENGESNFYMYTGGQQKIGGGSTQVVDSEFRMISDTDSDPISGDATESGLTFKDADGIEQFTSSFALFDGFGFDPATKTLINPKTVLNYTVTNQLNSKNYNTDFEESNSGGITSYKMFAQKVSNTERNVDFELKTNWGSPNDLRYRFRLFNQYQSQSMFNAFVIESLPELNNAKVVVQGDLEVTRNGKVDNDLTVEGFLKSKNVQLDFTSFGELKVLSNQVSNTERNVDFELKTLWGTPNNLRYRFRLFNQYQSQSMFNAFVIESLPELNNAKVSITGDLIVSRKLKAESLDLSALGKYADDAAAGAAGVPIDFAYINSATGAVHSRQS